MNRKEKSTFWALPFQDVFDHLKSSEKGLTDSEVKVRINQYGFNEIARKEKRHSLEIFVSQFKNTLVLVLMAAAVISYLLGERIDAAVILSIVFINSVLGFFQEYRAEKALKTLKEYVTFRAKVLRNGEMTEIETKNVVPGDIVSLTIGDIIPADMRLFNVHEMTTDESALTGESLPVLKKTTTLLETETLPQNLVNMVFMGTSVASGSGKGIVTATGEATFFGKTAAFLEEKPQEADFQRNIRKFSNFLLKIILMMTAFIFLANALLGKGVFPSFLFAIALAVGITPEVLPIIMTISLSNGALKMAKEKVITKRLASVEDFGNIDTLCCDKTGTLTEGALSLSGYTTADGEKDSALVLYGMVCSAVTGKKGKRFFGNPLDSALWQSKEAYALEDDVETLSIIGRNEFDFERRRMGVLVKGDKDNILVVKGAPESILECCTSVKIKNDTVDLAEMSSIRDQISTFEKEGFRVIAVAGKHIQKNEITINDETGLTLLGFLLFLDPPKETAKKSLKTLQRLGVAVKVISGDSPTVTKKICHDVGLSIIERVITGTELESLNESEFAECSLKYNVFARVAPEQKFKIVESLTREGHIVGFLGDGINDAPALRAADVGISVDTATGIAKETADIILLDKSLRVLAHGIVEGRKTFGNITKYILNTTSANYGNMFTVALSSLFLGFIPLLPSQILLNNFISDFPLLTISTDNVDQELLKRPRRWNISLIRNFMIYFGAMSSFFDLVLILSLTYLIKVGPELFRTSWFVLSALSEIVVTFAIRTKLPVFKSKPSKWLVITSIAAGIGVVAITYTSVGTFLFEFVRMPSPILALMAGVLMMYFITAEVVKRYFFRHFEI